MMHSFQVSHLLASLACLPACLPDKGQTPCTSLTHKGCTQPFMCRYSSLSVRGGINSQQTVYSLHIITSSINTTYATFSAHQTTSQQKYSRWVRLLHTVCCKSHVQVVQQHTHSHTVPAPLCVHHQCSLGGRTHTRIPPSRPAGNWRVQLLSPDTR